MRMVSHGRLSLSRSVEERGFTIKMSEHLSILRLLPFSISQSVPHETLLGVRNFVHGGAHQARV